MEGFKQSVDNPYKFVKKISENLSQEIISRTHPKEGMLYHIVNVVHNTEKKIDGKAILERHYGAHSQVSVFDFAYIFKDDFLKRRTREYQSKPEITYFIGKKFIEEGKVKQNDKLYNIVDDPVKEGRALFKKKIIFLEKELELDLFMDEMDYAPEVSLNSVDEFLQLYSPFLTKNQEKN